MIKQKLIFLWGHVRRAPANLWRNKFVSVTTFVLGMLIVFWINIVFSLQYLSQYTLESLEKRADFMIPLVDSYDSFTFESLDNELTTSQFFEVQTQIIPPQRIGTIDLPSRYHVKFQSLEAVADVFEILKKDRYVDLIGDWDPAAERDFSELAERILSVRGTVLNITYWFIGLFIVGGVLLIGNTFQLALFNRKEEIFIARMVGARKTTIMTPFVVEGCFLGLASSLVAILLFTVLLTQIDSLPSGAIFLYLWEYVYIWELLITMVVGGVGAFYAAGRYVSKTTKRV